MASWARSSAWYQSPVSRNPGPPQGPELAGEELQEVRVVACHHPPPEVAVGRTILDQLHAVPARRVAGNQAGSWRTCSTAQGLRAHGAVVARARNDA